MLDHPLDRWFRVAAFLSLELLYLALAAYCLVKPIVIPSMGNTRQKEVKGALTILSVAWQTLALFPVRDVVTFVFSGEWSHLVSSTGTLIVGKTDRVSTLTSGQVDRLRHSVDSKASRSYRIAYFSSLVFMGLAAIAPGVISIVNVLVPQSMSLSIGNMTITLGIPFEFHHSTYDAIERAWLITRLEQVEKSRYGYENPKGWVVGWPPLGLPSNGSGAIEYLSDVVHYEFACQWEVPTLADELFGDAPIYIVNNINWTVWDELGSISNLPATTYGTILPLAQTDFQANSSLSAYVLQGGNQSLMVHDTYYFLDLTGIPSAYNLTNSTTPLTTILLCDPKPSVSGGRVRLDVDNTLTVVQSGLPSTVGNIPISAANVILSSGLLGPVSEQELQNTAKMIINYICELLFLVDPSLNLTNYPMGVPPLDIESINNNMDIFFGSASKAYTDGYYSIGSAIPTFTTVSVEAEQGEPRLAFASSKLLFIVYASLLGVATVLALLLGLGVGDGKRKREPFTLGTVAWAVQVLRVLDGGDKVDANAGSSTGPECPSASYRPTYQRVSPAEESELA
ncbi:hypothetical protein JAAARDRAFT_200730 [Jaapia argillacea MUCL 33604]|uniref:Uncharacterized protein n=1 Tax=Jaapia argillacea MUCL 33604 TaxID=933084 RepID=A0A067P489_9AGAM|nr:hypothetical protein JAAARDRAFT_200730 [Jaapia argillacea MUCL 33604]